MEIDLTNLSLDSTFVKVSPNAADSLKKTDAGIPSESMRLPALRYEKCPLCVENEYSKFAMYTGDDRTIALRMNSGDYGPEIFLTEDVTGLSVYNKNLTGFILVDIVYASLSNDYDVNLLRFTVMKSDFDSVGSV